MKSFFEDLGRKLGETAETVTNKAGEAVEIQRLKNQIRTLERENERDYAELGEMVYEQFLAGKIEEPEVVGICEAIQNREESISGYEKQIVEVKGEVKCESCGKPVAKGMAFCPNCGTKAPEPAKENENEDEAEDLAEKAGEAAGKAYDKAADFAGKVVSKVDRKSVV